MVASIVTTLALASVAYGAIRPRGITTNPSDLADHTFDYVIIGCGTAASVVANRLTEDSTTTVAVIEAGTEGADVKDRVDIPALTYLEGVSVPGSKYDWGYFATALNRVQHWPRGKILGGSSAVNAEYVVRASKIEHDAWASLNPGADTDWSWEGLFPYMFVSENYHPPNDANATAASIKVDTSFHNNAGPIHSSYPYFMYEQANMWVPTLANLGIDTRDPGKGEGWGAYLTPNAIDPATSTRSYAKAYIDPVVGRPNLSILLGHQVTKISMGSKGPNGLPKPDYVEFTAAANSTRYQVKAKKEVILSAGVIGTPHLLQLSGIGPKALLDSLQIPTVVDLPGVGEHLQDHVLIPVVWSTNASVTGDAVALSNDLKAQQLALFRSGQFSQTLYSAANNGIAYINLRQLLGNDRATTFMGQLRSNITSLLDVFYNTTNDAVKQGYNLTFQTEIDQVIDSNVGVIELLLSNTGTFNPTNKTLSIQASLQHPFSRGSVVITSTDPFTVPKINTNYLTSDADWVILREGLRYARMVGNTAPLSSVITGEIQPGPGVATDAEIDNYIWTNAATQYHPASTASQLPRDKGGVVDTELRVYGTEGLRVIDSSIIPIGLCAHLMMPTFAIGEKGAGIITGAPPPSTVVHNDGAPKFSLTFGKTPLLTLLGVIYLALA